MNGKEIAGKYSILTPLLDPAFGIPTDVTFQIFENYEGNNLEICQGNVEAHKMVLGLVSPVFKSEFFGPAKETKDIIPVRQTTLKSFKLLIDYIYSIRIEWSKLSILELYDVVNLAEKYQIQDLLEELVFHMEQYPLTMQTVLEIAETAEQFTQFPKVSGQLLTNCSKFLKTNLNTDRLKLQFALDQ